MPARMMIALAFLGSLGRANAPQAANPSFPVTFSQARQALDQMSAHPRRLDRPLVLIGGLLHRLLQCVRRVPREGARRC